MIDAPTAERLARAVSLRNVVAHGYAVMSVDTLHEAAGEGLADLEAFAEQVSVWTEDKATS